MSDGIDNEIDEMREIIDDFLIEADELIQSLDTNLVKLESTPGDLDLLNEIFRAAHTIKGTSSFLGFEKVTSLTHKMEDVLNKLRKGEFGVTPEMMDLLLESLDILKVLMDNVRSGVGNEGVNIDDVKNRLIVITEGGSPEIAETDEAEGAEESLAEEVSSPEPQVEAAPATGGEQKPSAPVDRTGFDKAAIDHTIRVEVQRLDSLMDLMGELVLGRNILVEATNKMNKEDADGISREGINEATATISYITTELQMAVMKMRMQPVGKVFARFPRLVRDLARDTKKKINLIISGEDTELDKSVIEEIGDPLVHIIRNSCDHGIEPPEDRQAAGKPAMGTVRLTASQEGSNIVIEVVDDGKGLDVEAIRAKAVDRGLVSQSDAERMPSGEIYRFIFEAGFSTAKVVSGISGRGVGMDVVRTNIEKLNGMVEVDSEVGVGTRMRIKLPLTLAIVQGLLVESDNDIYILPMASVVETVKTEQSLISYVNKRPVLQLRDEVIPVINLSAMLEGNSSGFIMSEKPYIVIVGLAERKLGLNVDRFLGQEEVVIKSLGEHLSAAEGIAGATIMGDGRIRLIVDLIGLFNITKKQA